MELVRAQAAQIANPNQSSPCKYGGATLAIHNSNSPGGTQSEPYMLVPGAFSNAICRSTK
jgi:hypothetical protein